MTSLGGGDNIGDSCHWYKFPSPWFKNGYCSVLVDFGRHPNGRLPDISEVDHVDFIIITHLHRDHVGGLPWICRKFPTAVVIMTQPTLDLSEKQWLEEIAFMDRAEKERGITPLFTKTDLTNLFKSNMVRVVSFWERLWLNDDLSLTVPEAGHVAGAMSCLFDYKNGKNTVYHTGDFSMHDQLLIHGAATPKTRVPIGTIVSESTYLGMKTLDRAAETEKFLACIREILRRNGKVLAPMYKYHREQEMWELLLKNGIPPSLIAIDGGGADKLFEMFGRHTPLTMPASSQFIGGDRARQAIMDDSAPRIIFAHGGMLQQGSPSFRWLKAVCEDEKNGIVLNGYVDPCSSGGEILEQLRHGKQAIQVGEGDDMEELTLACELQKFSLSAHASGDEIEEVASRARDQVVFVHGDRKRVRKHLKKGTVPNALFPRNGKEVIL